MALPLQGEVVDEWWIDLLPGDYLGVFQSEVLQKSCGEPVRLVKVARIQVLEDKTWDKKSAGPLEEHAEGAEEGRGRHWRRGHTEQGQPMKEFFLL